MNEKKKNSNTFVHIIALRHLAINWVYRIPHQLCLEKERTCKCQHKNISDILGTWSVRQQILRKPSDYYIIILCVWYKCSVLWMHRIIITNINWLGFYCSNIIKLFWCTMTRLCLLLPNSKCIVHVCSTVSKDKNSSKYFKALVEEHCLKSFLKNAMPMWTTWQLERLVVPARCLLNPLVTIQDPFKELKLKNFAE